MIAKIQTGFTPLIKMNTSVSSSYSKEHVPPFTASYAQRISKIHEQREIQSRIKEEDIIHSRSAIGSTFRVSGPDNSRVYSGDRSFGLVRPLSVGRQRDESAGRSGSTSFRSTSTERNRTNNDSHLSYSSVQRTMTSFDRELQVQKDIAAVEKQKLALLQVKKESYINYLKNKGNTPWIPGGDGAKYATSLHKSVNRDAIEQRQLKQAWCRSPWPGAIPQPKSTTPGRSRPGGGRPYDLPSTSQSPSRSQDPSSSEYSAFSPDRSASLRERPLRAATSPQRLPTTRAGTGAAGRDRADSDVLSIVSSAAPSVASSHRSRVTNSAPGTGAGAPAPPAGSNSKYVALTVRLINTAHPAQKSSYGVFIVPRNCSRLEMIAHIERQFSVHNQVSDISITYRSGYSHSVTVKSLSMGTIADIPDVNDYSSITIYLGGSTVFDSAGNIITKSAEGEVISSKTAVFNPSEATPLPPPKSPSFSSSSQQQQQLRRVPSGTYNATATSGLASVSVSSVPGLDIGDTLQYFDGVDVVSVDDENSTFSDDESAAAPSTTATARTGTGTGAGTGTGNGSTAPPLEKVPLYESLHPLQKQHSFSYVSPAKPLLGQRDAGSVLSSPKGSYYSLLPATTTEPSHVRTSYEIQSYLLDAEPSTNNAHLRAASADENESATSGSRFHGESLKRSILTKKSSARDRDRASAVSAAPYQGSSANLYMYEESTPVAVSQGSEEEKAQHPSSTNSNSFAGRPPAQFYSSEQTQQARAPRDWLAEAEAQVQLEQRNRAARSHHTPHPTPSVTSSRQSQQSSRRSVDDLVLGSPAYRANTISSQSRQRERPVVPAVRGRSRSRSRSDLDSQRATSASGRRSLSTGRARSLSADATSRVQHQWRPLPMPVSPAPVIRTTAASRGRNAFINSRATDYVAVRDVSAGRARSNSAGTTRSLADVRRYHSFSHNELPPMDDAQGYDDVWLSDPAAGRGVQGGHYDERAYAEQWGTLREPREQQRVAQYQDMYADDEPEQQPYASRERAAPRINEGPQAGGAGDSIALALDAEDLSLPWSHRPEQERSQQYPQQQSQWGSSGGDAEGYGYGFGNREGESTETGHNTSAVSRRGSGRSASGSKHFAMNLDELLAEMA